MVKSKFWNFLVIIILIFFTFFNATFFSYINPINSDFVSDFLLIPEIGNGKIYFGQFNHILKYPYYLLIAKVLGFNLFSIITIDIINIAVLFLTYFLFAYITFRPFFKKSLIYLLLFLPLLNSSLFLYRMLADPFNRNLEISLYFVFYYLFFLKDSNIFGLFNYLSLKKKILFFIFLFIFALWIFSDSYWLIVFVIPFVVLTSKAFIKDRKSTHIRTLSILAVFILMIFLIKLALGNSPYFSFNENKINLFDLSRTRANIHYIITGISKFFYIDSNGDNAPFTLFRNLINVFILVISLIGFFISILCTSKIRRFFIFSFISILLLLFILLFSNIIVDLSSMRYLIIAPFILFLSLPHLLIRLQNKNKIILWVFYILIFLSTIFNFASNLNLLKFYSKPYEIEKKKLVDYLADLKVNYGYSDYWHSPILTFLSGNKIKIRQVICIDGKIKPYLFLASSNWYKSKELKSSLLLLSNDAGYSLYLQACSQSLIIKQFGIPQKIVKKTVGNTTYTILVFNYNIAERF